MAEKPIIQVAAGLIVKNGVYLIAKRKAGVHLEGLWEFPGGKREAGESLQECLRRELKEELTIEIEMATAVPFRVIRHAYPDKVVEIHFFVCSIRAGEPRALGCDEIRWVPPNELHAYQFPPADEPLLETLQRVSSHE